MVVKTYGPHHARVPAVYLSFAIQADVLVVKVTPHFGQRI
jgi:hypothetical protein